MFTYGPPVALPPGYLLQEPIIVHERTKCRFVWRETRWVHMARCLCWRRRH